MNHLFVYIYQYENERLGTDRARAFHSGYGDGNFINSTVGIPSVKKLSSRWKYWREAVTDSTLRTSATDAVGKWRKKFRKNRLAAVARKFSLGNGSKKEFPEFLPSLTDGIGRGRSQCGIRNGLPSIFPATAQLFGRRCAYGTINKITVDFPAGYKSYFIYI